MSSAYPVVFEEALVLELCGGGCLLQLLQQSRPASLEDAPALSLRQLCQLIWQIADGCDYLHARRILHR